MANPSVSKAIVKALGDQLLSGMSKLNQVLHDFPDPTEKLSLPALSIVSGTPEFRPFSPYTYNKSDLIELDSDTIEAKVLWAIGWYDFSLQLDLWCGSKFERHGLWEDLFTAFNSQFPVHGLSLNLREYHGVIARYDLQGYRIEDSEDQSQRKEWRVRAEVLAQCVAIREQTDKLIKQGEIQFNSYANDSETKSVSFE